MLLLGKEIITTYKAYANFKSALDRFVTVIEMCDAKHFVDLKKSFGSADSVGKQTVIDVAGNSLRVVLKIAYPQQIATVQHVLDHTEYDKGKWKE